MTPDFPSPAIPRQVHNRIGVIGAGSPMCCSFSLATGVPVSRWCWGAACWGLQRRMKAQAAASRANTLVRIAGFVLVAGGELRAHDAALATRGHCGRQPAAWVGSVVGEGLVAGLDFLGATLVMIAAWMAGLSLAFGVSWLTIMDRLGALAWAGIGRLRTRSAAARDAAEGRERRQARKEAMESDQKKVRHRGRHRASSRRCRLGRGKARASSANARCRCSIRPRRVSCRH